MTLNQEFVLCKEHGLPIHVSNRGLLQAGEIQKNVKQAKEEVSDIEMMKTMLVFSGLLD